MGGGDRSRSRDRREKRSRDRKDRSRERDRAARKEDNDGGGAKAERNRSRDRDRSKRDEGPKVDSDPEDDEFRPGRTVVVKGLQKNPEKNGSIGKLLEFNKDKGRWSVELTGGSNNFKEENLELMPDNSDVVKDDEEPPTAKIYIQGLSADTTEKDLQALFGGCGMIAKEKPKSRTPGFEDQWPYAVKLYKPGKSNGDACVTYMDSFAAKAAIKTYNRYKFKGSKIKVQYAGQGRQYEAVELQLPWHLRPENMGKMDKDSGGGGGGGAGGKPDDWTCDQCGAMVFASRSTCFKCGASKPGGGSSGPGGGGSDHRLASGKGGGGAADGGDGRPGTWTCPDCGSTVFAHKSHCYKCGGAKPRGGGGRR